MNKKTNYNKIIFLFLTTLLTTSYSTMLAVKYGAPQLMQLVRQVQTHGFLSTDDEKDIQYFFASHGRNPNISFEGGNTLLHYAIMFEDDPKDLLVDAEFSPQQELVRYLLFDLGVDPNVSNHQKQTPLHVALARKNEPAIQLLLKHEDIRLKDPDDDGLTPLHLAAMTDNFKATEFLLSKGIPVSRDRFNRSPLFYAVQNQNPRTTQRFLPLSTAADVLLTFHQLEELRQEDALKFYANQLQPIIKKQETEKFRTFLHAAATEKDVTACAFLITAGANSHCEDRYAESPFYVALKTESEALIALLKGGIDLNTLNYKRQPVLHHFAQGRYYKTMQILIDLGADPLVKDGAGKSALYYALVNHEEVLLRILNQHHEIDRDTVDGIPLVHFFIKTGNKKMIRALRTLHASLETVNAEGKTPLLCMVEAEQWGLVAEAFELTFPRKTQIDEIDVLNAARAQGNTDLFRSLIACSLDVEAYDEYGKTLLCKAVQDEDEAGVEMLLSLHGNPTTKDDHGNTPLHFAARDNKRIIGIAEKLIPFYLRERTIRTVDVKNDSGLTPLHVTAAEGNAPIACLLLANGANVTEQDRTHKTPLAYTFEQKNIPLAQIFVRAWIHRINAQESTAGEFATDILESSRALARMGNPVVEDLPFIATMNEFFTNCIEEDVTQERISEDLGDACLDAISSALRQAPNPTST